MTLRPTAAFTRSWMLVLVAGLVAVFLGRADILILACPFIIHLGWGLLTNTKKSPEVTVSNQAALLNEGEVLSYRLVADQWPGFLAAQLRASDQLLLCPSSGVQLGASELSIDVEPLRWGTNLTAASPIVMTDVAGCWRREIEAKQLRLVVRPHVELISGGTGVAQPIGISGVHRSRRRGDGTELAEVRDYVSGDRLRRINWPVTSRLPGVYVNAMYVESDTDVLIVVDSDLDIGLPGRDSSLDLQVRAIAGITRHYCGFGDRVAIHDLGQRIGFLRPGTGSKQLRYVMHRLARARSSGNQFTSMQPVRSLASGTIVFVCSPMLDQKVQGEVLRLRRLGGEVVIIDTMPEDLGVVRGIYDPQTCLDEAWALRRLEHDELVAQLRQAGIPVVAWRGATSLSAVLQALASARQAPRIRR